MSIFEETIDRFVRETEDHPFMEKMTDTTWRIPVFYDGGMKWPAVYITRVGGDLFCISWPEHPQRSIKWVIGEKRAAEEAWTV